MRIDCADRRALPVGRGEARRGRRLRRGRRGRQPFVRRHDGRGRPDADGQGWNRDERHQREAESRRQRTTDARGARWHPASDSFQEGRRVRRDCEPADELIVTWAVQVRKWTNHSAGHYANRGNRVGITRSLVAAIAFHSGESQREPTRIHRAGLDLVERDLHDELRPHVDRASSRPVPSESSRSVCHFSMASVMPLTSFPA